MYFISGSFFLNLYTGKKMSIIYLFILLLPQRDQRLNVRNKGEFTREAAIFSQYTEITLILFLIEKNQVFKKVTETRCSKSKILFRAIKYATFNEILIGMHIGYNIGELRYGTGSKEMAAIPH